MNALSCFNAKLMKWLVSLYKNILLLQSFKRHLEYFLFLNCLLLKNKNYIARNVSQYVSPSILYINEGN